MLSFIKIYFWKGITSSGKSCHGKELACSLEELCMKLYRQDIFVKYIHKRWIIRVNKRASKQEIFLFTRQISRLLAAGLPFIQIMKLLESSIKNTLLKDYFKKIIINVENGYSITEAIKQKESYFSKFHCSLIALGEKTASLELMFDRIAIHQEKSLKLKSRITHALVYPIVVLFVACLVFIALLLGVVPQFEQLFTELGAQLPLLTQVIIYLSKRMGSLSIYCGASLSSFSTVFFFLKKKFPIVNNILDKFYIKLPVINNFLTEIIIARISRALSIALGAGLPLLDSLQLIAGMTTNYVYKTIILDCCEQIRNGDNFHQALAKQQALPTEFIQLIKVGEIANCLGEILSNTADLYEEKIDYFVDNLAVLLEPLLIVILGLMIGCLVTAMYLPIFKLGSVI